MRASGSPLFMRLISSFLLVLQGYLFHAQGQGRKFTREQRQQQKQLRRRHNADRANLLSSLESQGRNATETAGVSRANWRGMPGAAKDSTVVMMGGEDAASQESRVTETSIRGFWKAYRKHMDL